MAEYDGKEFDNLVAWLRLKAADYGWQVQIYHSSGLTTKYERELAKIVGHPFDRHQIIARDYKIDDPENVVFSCICQHGSCGFEYGLLEVRGKIVEPELYPDQVRGYLTSHDVINMIENYKGVQLI